MADQPFVTRGFAPVVRTDDRDFTIVTEHGRHQWSWDELQALGPEDVTPISTA